MSNNIDFKDLWSKQATTIPDTKDLLKKARKFKRNNLYKLIAMNALLVFTSIFIGFIWYYFQPQLLTTKIGIILVILAMLIFLTAFNTIIPLLLKKKNSNSSNHYLKQLLKLKEKQLFLQTIMMNVYFLLLSTGLSLYTYEYASKMTVTWFLFTYVIILGWIGLNWFYFRQRTIQKQQTKINKLINEFKRLNDQLAV